MKVRFRYDERCKSLKEVIPFPSPRMSGVGNVLGSETKVVCPACGSPATPSAKVASFASAFPPS